MSWKKKLFSSLKIIICVIVISACVMCVNAKEINKSNNRIQRFVDVQCEVAELSKNLDSSSILPEVYSAMESIKTIDGDKRIANKTAVQIFNREALYWYATRNGFSISDRELDNQLKLLIKECKTTEEYKVIEKAYNKNGTSLKDNIYDNYRFYEKGFVINKMYDSYQMKYEEGGYTFGGIEYDTWDLYWDAVKDTAIDEYTKTNDYDKFDVAMDESIKIIKDEVDGIISGRISEKQLSDINESTSVYDELTYQHSEILGE